MLQGIISSFYPKLLAVGSFRKHCLDSNLLCCLFSVLITSQVLEGVGDSELSSDL